MPSLIIPTPEQTNPVHSTSPPRLPPIVPPVPRPNGTASEYPPGSPVAPEFSPITPKAQPALPATHSPHTAVGLEATLGATADAPPIQPPTAIVPTAEFIPAPPPQPFSSEDATDAIALRAAISSLQFQKKKAQDDIRELERIRKKALGEPALFKTELAAGRLNEQRPKIGNLQSILDDVDSGDDEDEVVLGASEGEVPDSERDQNGMDTEVLNSQRVSRPSSSNSNTPLAKNGSPPFGRLPGPQNVVRMPYVNWDKYHITGEPLDQLHDLQRKWPGSFPYGHDRGREYAVAAPYSPWLDPLDIQQPGWDAESRNDSVATPGTAVTPTTVSEHPMETRRKQMFQ